MDRFKLFLKQSFCKHKFSDLQPSYVISNLIGKRVMICECKKCGKKKTVIL